MDADMLGGYGSKTLEPVQKLAGNKTYFPLTLGRDFSGVVVDVGQGISSSVFKPGDEVWGVVNPLTRSKGAHAEYLVAEASETALKPKGLSHTEAASFPYVVCTAWSAITKSGGITQNNAKGKKVLILGAAGGVGSYSVQLLKAWNANITATCSTNNVDDVLKLGADIVIDYKTHNVSKELDSIKGFDLILDCVKEKPEPISVWMNMLKSNANATYVTLNGPMLRNNDSMGFPFGFLKSALDLVPNTLKYRAEGKHIAWGLFLPSKIALDCTASLINEGKMHAFIDKVYSFEQIPEVFTKVASRHGKGKSVIDMKI